MSKVKIITKDNTVDVSAYLLGKIVPESDQFEQAVLGAIMLENDCLEENATHLSEGLFYKKAHRLIYCAIMDLYNKNNPAEIITVSNRLKETGDIEACGGPSYISQLTSNIASSANIGFHIFKLKELYIKRSIIRISAKALEESFEYEVDVFEHLTHIQREYDIISAELIGKDIDFDPGKSIDNTIKHLISIKDKEYLGHPTGNAELSRDIGGFQNGDLIILAARPSQGKTDRMLNFACSLAEKNTPVAIFSLETKIEHKINIRLLSRYSRVDNYVLRSGKWDDNQMQAIADARDRIAALPFFIYDQCIMSPSEIRAICRKLKREKGLGMVFGDYLQLVSPDEHIKGNREQEISQISRAFKLIAKELDIPMMWLSQLNRDLEKRNNKRPQLSDLRESGAIEQDAEVVLGLYSPFKSGETCESYGWSNTQDFELLSEIITLKIKEGPVNKQIIEYYHRNMSLFTSEANIHSQVPNQPDLPF